MNSFINGMKNESNRWTLTENGAPALNTTGNKLLDLYGMIGSLRTRSNEEIERLFVNAFNESPLYATRMAFYARNIRGGLGERNTSRVIWKWIACHYPSIMITNMHLVPLFGRWDDLYTFIDTPVEDAMWEVIFLQWMKDVKSFNAGEPVSIMAKWLKSVNTSSAESNRLGKMTAKMIGLSEKNYRKTLSNLRAKIDVVERKMSSDNWNEINYQGVPSKAMANYRKAFQKHDEEGFGAYMANVESGKATINSGTLFPYEIFEKMGLNPYGGYYGDGNFTFNSWDRVLEEQWKALPNYVNEEWNVLVMADTSGSMNGRPMATALSLAVYFAERNSGPYKDHFLTFSSSPSFVNVAGKNLKEKIKNIPSIVSHTNLAAAFDLVLNVAVQNKIEANEMPKALVVISDMEIDNHVCGGGMVTFYDEMKARFARCGYEMPNVIFWNVNARHDVFHAESDYKGVQLASGSSASTFKAVLEAIGSTAIEAMMKVLDSEMYSCVVIE